MPVISSPYRAEGIFKNGHFSTIFSAKIRRVYGVRQQRERLILGDRDFMDIDWSFSQGENKKRQVALLFHGLEGNARRPYMLGTAKILNQNGYDCAAVNLRGCSGEKNLQFRSYHSGATDDVVAVLEHILEQAKYRRIFLVGFSLGGNLVLKYLGENRSRPNCIIAAAAISTPVDLYGSLKSLEQRENWIYRWSFLKDLRGKYKSKIQGFPEQANPDQLKKIKSLRMFDELYTAPAHGFENALDYYTKSSSLPFLRDIKIPSLLLNAKNDSFLDSRCYPVSIASANSNLYLEMPEEGGHVGFVAENNIYYNEKRTLGFFEEQS